MCGVSPGSRNLIRMRWVGQRANKERTSAHRKRTMEQKLRWLQNSRFCPGCHHEDSFCFSVVAFFLQNLKLIISRFYFYFVYQILLIIFEISFYGYLLPQLFVWFILTIWKAVNTVSFISCGYWMLLSTSCRWRVIWNKYLTRQRWGHVLMETKNCQ